MFVFEIPSGYIAACSLVFINLQIIKRSIDPNRDRDIQMMHVFLINSLIVAIAVLIHYEFLYRLNFNIPRMKIKHRLKLVFFVFGVFAGHVIEIWLFALAYYWMHKSSAWGELTGNFNGSLLDCGYFSFTVYSTVGFGDIAPVGDIRYLTGIESLLGLILIAWSASFLYMQMQKEW